MAATPSGRVPPSGFGMFTRRDGVVRYAPECTRSCRSTSRPSSPSSYIRQVMPSAPAAASFFSSKNAWRNASTVTWWRSAVRRSRGSRCTNCRIRSAACDALPRHCVRRALWLSGFPSGSALGSIGSVGTDAPCSPTSQLLRPSLTSPCCPSSVRIPPFLSDPAHDSGMARRPPRSRCSAYVRAWVLRHRGIPPPLAIAVGRMLPSAMGEDLGIPDEGPFGAQ